MKKREHLNKIQAYYKFSTVQLLALLLLLEVLSCQRRIARGW